MRKRHPWDLAYASGHLYARCGCGWEGARRPLADTSPDSPGNQAALRAAAREGAAHAQDVTHQDGTGQDVCAGRTPQAQSAELKDAPAYRPGRGWRANAACVGLDAQMFFPVGTTGRALDQIAQAKAVCQRCPVLSTCLEWALATNQDAGVWGGLTEDERRAHKRRRKPNQYGP